MEKKLSEFLAQIPLFQRVSLCPQERTELIRVIEEEYLVSFLATIIREAEEIMAIDPRLPPRTILELAAKCIVASLKGAGATIRLFDPESLTMTSFGAYGVEEDDRLAAVPVQDSISGAVIKEKRSIQVPSILKEPSYKDKEIVTKKGFRSLLAVPLFQPTYLDAEQEMLGSLQIYYQEDDKVFAPLEVIHAELLARRVSYVLAKKKVLALQDLNSRREKIVNKIFIKLSRREGIKLKDLFIQLLPELEEFIQIQSCSLFTVSDDRQFVRQDGSYPSEQSFHQTGHSFYVHDHPCLAAALGDNPHEDTACERIAASYVLIKDPLRSRLIDQEMRTFAHEHRVHSILLIPLRIDLQVRQLLVFYASEQKQFFSDEEIELLTFFGKEIMKASRLEFMGDMLHDFKNPAIAVAGFAARMRSLLQAEELEPVRGRLQYYTQILIREAARIQDLALAMTDQGREELLDLALVAYQRFRINEEVVRESRREKLLLHKPQLKSGLFVFCPRFGLERIIDNLLHNATKGIPESGGELALRGYREDIMACLEIRNSGEIPAPQLLEVQAGRGVGRGLSIVSRFLQQNNGLMTIVSQAGQTVCTIKLPFSALE